MRGKRIHIVEDDPDIVELLTFNLEKEGFITSSSLSGEKAVNDICKNQPDLVLLDRLLPGKDGMEICRELKQNRETTHIPIIMVTVKDEESDIISGLEIGANDYVTKPFSPQVLIARIRNVLRKERNNRNSTEPAIIKAGKLQIDPAKHRVVCDGRQVVLSSTEFSILLFLARNPDWVYSRERIINAVHGDDYPVTERSIDVQIFSIRKKLGEYGKCIQTVRGIGYTLRTI